jgi:hypothetical protein
MDTYQAVYDAVRSKISGGNITQAVMDAIRESNIAFYAEQACRSAQEAANEHSRPCILFKPVLSLDGNKWCALYGSNLQEGVAGFGDSPAEAMYAFDAEWNKKIGEQP